MADLDQALREQLRVLKPGGRWVALDTTRPRRSLLSPFIHFHMHTVIPLLGTLLTGQRDAYTYLPDSSEAFLRAEELAAHLAAAGFRKVGFPPAEFRHGGDPLGREAMSVRRLVVGISGSSGVILGIRLLQALQGGEVETHLVVTPGGAPDHRAGDGLEGG